VEVGKNLSSVVVNSDNIRVCEHLAQGKNPKCLHKNKTAEFKERLQDTIIREIKEETNFDVREEDLELIDVVSGSSRRNDYPNGDVVLNNTVLYCIRNYSGNLEWNNESKIMKFSI
jgi:hypothetical protein